MTEVQEERRLGMRWDRRPNDPTVPKRVKPTVPGLTTSLWPVRWPAIALQVCIDEVKAAPADKRAEVKFNLPCQTCEKNTACLNAKRKELGPLLYDREIMTSPRSSESSMFPAEVFDPLKIDTPCVAFWQPPFSLEHQYKVIQSWDLAWSEKIGGDFLVNVTASVHLPTGTRRLLDIQRWQRVPFDDQIDLMEARWKQYDADAVVIEADAAQKIWAQRAKKTTPVPVVEHTAGEKRHFVDGVPGLLIQFANRKWEIPWVPGSLHHDEVSNMVDEFEAFGWNDGKLEGVGEHDDTVMAFWHCSWMIDRLLKGTMGGKEHHRGVVEGARP